MMLDNGTRLDSYEILEHLGSGGMGSVYRARDVKLQREIALKVLSGELSRPEHLARFQREARVLASLDHPGISSILGIGDSGDSHYLVLEFVPGPTLDVWFRERERTAAEILAVGLQIAEALEVAHEHGVIHRDLKPLNVKVRPGGRVTVLDFGLAKVRPDPAPEGATVETGLTVDGRLLGTPAYMSPEQARGLPVDRRTDLWALGCILYEGLAGRPAFPGRTAADVLAAVMGTEPDEDALPRTVSPEIRNLLALCLAKDPARRLQSAGEARREIQAILDRKPDPGREPAGSGWLHQAGQRVSEAFSALVGRGSRRDGPGRRRPAPRLTQETFNDALETSPAWFPDGRSFVFCREVGGVRKVFRKDAGAAVAVQLTRGDHDDLQPAVSPDGRRLLFVRGHRAGEMLQPGDVFGVFTGADLWSLDLESGVEAKLVGDAFNPSFSPDGSRLAVDASWAGPRRIWMMDSRGRNPQQVTSDTSEVVRHVRPRWSPDGKEIVFQNEEWTQFNVRCIDLEAREYVWITRDLSINVHPAWSPDGRHVYFSSYRGGGINIWRTERDGAPASPEQVTTGAGQDLEPTLSPDGRRLAFSILRQNADLWRLPLDPETGSVRGEPEKVVATTREDSRGAWDSAGTRIAFNSDRAGEMNVWVRSLEDGSERQITRGPGGDFQPNWSPDGGRLVFFSSREGAPAIWRVDLESRKPTRLSRPGAIEINPFFSPDGKSVAYQSDRDGRLELWVMEADGGNPRKLTRIGIGGHFLRWTDGGASIVFRCPVGSDAGIYRIGAGGGEPERLAEVVGGSHISLSPDESLLLDVVNHRTLWVSPLEAGEPRKVFEFDDPDVRIDYPVWSPDGKWAIFDRFRPSGGDVWVMEGIA